jgi:hypothetical protein
VKVSGKGRRTHNVVLSGLALLLAVSSQSVAAAAGDDGPPRDLYGKREGSAFVVGGRDRTAAAAGVAKSAVVPEYEFKRMPAVGCGFRRVGAREECPAGDPLQLSAPCADGRERLEPLFRRPADGSAGWDVVDDGCPETAPEAVTLSVEEFRRLPLVASVPSIQPADGRNLVGMPLIVYTDPGPQELVTTVVGVPVTVRATPTQFSWDFGDGSAPVVTADPGAPYPDHTVSHPFAQDGEYTVQLTTTWRGEFQVAGTTTWQPVAGTATTVSAPFTVTAEEAVPRLVAEP